MSSSTHNSAFLASGKARFALAVVFFVFPSALGAQAITIDSQGRIKGDPSAPVDRRYAQIEQTHVALGNSVLDPKTRIELIRLMQAEQGFAMRPLPRGHKGLLLVANGKVEPAGEAWLAMVTANGLSSKPGDRIVVTDLKVDHNRIIFDLNGGPDQKHRLLRHIEVGGGVAMTPVVRDDGQEPVGSRLTLVFEKNIPELTGSDVKALLAPLISFDVKTPVQAFTDTLPPVLKSAILDHHVMVGMSTDMVLFAMGQPESKTREMDGQMPFEEWIYGKAPKPVEFVRINGNRVIRLEIAKVGEQPEVFTQDEVSGLMRTDGTPLEPSRTRTVAMGDATYNPDTQAAPAPPSLKKPGEKLPDTGVGDPNDEMKPVQFPKPKPDAPPATLPANLPAPTPNPQPAPASPSNQL